MPRRPLPSQPRPDLVEALHAARATSARAAEDLLELAPDSGDFATDRAVEDFMDWCVAALQATTRSLDEATRER